jgi:hypothetical protein
MRGCSRGDATVVEDMVSRKGLGAQVSCPTMGVCVRGYQAPAPTQRSWPRRG